MTKLKKTFKGMKIILNGEEFEITEAQSPTISDLIKLLEIKSEKIAVEKNLEIISRESFDSTKIKEGDEIEMIHFIGGG